MASRAREGCQLVRQTVLFLNLLQKMGTFLVASRKHRPHHSIHLYTPRPDYISQRPLLIHTTHKNKALASDTTKPYLACIPPAIEAGWLLLRLTASRAREGCQPVRQTVLFLVRLQKMSPSDTFLVASRKHKPQPIYRSLQAPPMPARASLS